jgi:hypothetical protein
MNKEQEQTVDSIRVYCFDEKKLLKHVYKRYRGTLGANKSIKTNAYCEGLIMATGGYINVDTDSCYSYSVTELRTRGNNTDIVERIAVGFRIEARTDKDDGGYLVNTILRFRIMFDCADLIKNYCLPETKSLREFMGNRFNYNPRISKNGLELVKEINELYHYETQQKTIPGQAVA